MLSRKLFALFVLVWAIWFFVLIYLYFFVFYTATLVIESKVWDYEVELFSLSSAQKIQVSCPDTVCEIKDIPPFEYNITFKKRDYETLNISQKIIPRKKQTLSIELQKQAKIELIEREVKAEESRENRIVRLREENNSLLRFELSDVSRILFQESSNWELQMTYIESWREQNIGNFEPTPLEWIFATYIEGSKNIFLQLWVKKYIFDTQIWKLHILPYEAKISYIKTTPKNTRYHIVTEVWSFYYDILSRKSEFQYIFFDFITLKNQKTVWVIYPGDTERKNNYWFSDGKESLIVLFDLETKNRKILLSTPLKIQKILLENEEVYIVTDDEKKYKVENY